jgi:hypothetical protein
VTSRVDAVPLAGVNRVVFKPHFSYVLNRKRSDLSTSVIIEQRKNLGRPFLIMTPLKLGHRHGSMKGERVSLDQKLNAALSQFFALADRLL